MKTIIRKSNLKSVQKLFANKTSATILGKGPTFCVPAATSSDELIVCSNNTLNFCPRCDILVLNDVETLLKLDSEKVMASKTVLIPAHPHKSHKPRTDLIFTIFYKYFPNYSNPLIPYNLATIPKRYPEFFDLRSMICSPITAFEFILDYLDYIKNFNFYGVATLNEVGYHPYFVSCGNQINVNHGEKICGYLGCTREECNNSAKKNLKYHNDIIKSMAKSKDIIVNIN